MLFVKIQRSIHFPNDIGFSRNFIESFKMQLVAVVKEETGQLVRTRYEKSKPLKLVMDGRLQGKRPRV